MDDFGGPLLQETSKLIPGVPGRLGGALAETFVSYFVANDMCISTRIVRKKTHAIYSKKIMQPSVACKQQSGKALGIRLLIKIKESSLEGPPELLQWFVFSW